MKIKIDRNEPSLALFSKRTKYHGSSFIYVDDEFYTQNSAFGSTPEIVSMKLDRLDKKIQEDLKKNGVQRHTLQRESTADEDCLPW